MVSLRSGRVLTVASQKKKSEEKKRLSQKSRQVQAKAMKKRTEPARIVPTTSSESSPSEEPVPEEPLSYFNKGENGELLDGNAETYIKLGFGWVGADHPTRREWSEFVKKVKKEGFDQSRLPDFTDIIENLIRTSDNRPRSRSRSCSRSPTPSPTSSSSTIRSISKPVYPKPVERRESEERSDAEGYRDESYEYYPY